MDKILANRKPKVSEVSGWTRIFHHANIEVYEADNYRDYYKAIPKGDRPKYFFGESAWMNTQRFAVDKSDFSAYNIFS
jgi:hypothetical protein